MVQTLQSLNTNNAPLSAAAAAAAASSSAALPYTSLQDDNLDFKSDLVAVDQLQDKPTSNSMGNY
jgi:hypothetical protein